MLRRWPLTRTATVATQEHNARLVSSAVCSLFAARRADGGSSGKSKCFPPRCGAVGASIIGAAAAASPTAVDPSCSESAPQHLREQHQQQQQQQQQQLNKAVCASAVSTWMRRAVVPVAAGGTAVAAVVSLVDSEPVDLSIATARVSVNVARYLWESESVRRRREVAACPAASPDLTASSTTTATGVPNASSSSSTSPYPNEWPCEQMSLAELLELRDMCIGTTAAYVLARRGASALDDFLRESLPEYTADLPHSDDDHVVLVNHAKRQVFFSCRGTDGGSPERMRRDVLSYFAILRCTKVDPRDHTRITKTLKDAREAYAKYATRKGYAFRCIGHSLGGFAATVCAQELNCEATNFNGPVYRPQSGHCLTSAIIESVVEAAVHEDDGGHENSRPPLLIAAPPVLAADAAASPPFWPPVREGEFGGSSNQKINVAGTSASPVPPEPVAPAPAPADGKKRGTTSWHSAMLARLLMRTKVADAAVDAKQKEEEAAAKKNKKLTPVPTTPKQQRRTIARSGHVHHVQLGNDVVSLVGGALPHDCERFTRLRHDGGALDVSGAHFRFNIMHALHREILRAAATENVDVRDVISRPVNEHRVPTMKAPPVPENGAAV